MSTLGGIFSASLLFTRSMKCAPPKHTRPLAGPAGQLDSQIFPRSPAYLLNPATANKPFLAPKRLKPAFFINRQALPTIAEVMQALLVFSKFVHCSHHQRKLTTSHVHNQRSLNFLYWKKCQFCLLCNIILMMFMMTRRGRHRCYRGLLFTTPSY